VRCRKFWSRNRLGDAMRDRYNLNTLPYGYVDETLDGWLLPFDNVPQFFFGFGLISFFCPLSMLPTAFAMSPLFHRKDMFIDHFLVQVELWVRCICLSDCVYLFGQYL